MAEESIRLEMEADPNAIDDDSTPQTSYPRRYVENIIKQLNSGDPESSSDFNFTAADAKKLKERISEGYLWYHPPHPLFLSARAKKNELDPMAFCCPSVVFYIFPYLNLKKLI